MTFLAPLFWLLSALALPVIALYLVRERPRRQMVSNLLFWPQDQTVLAESSRWRKLRRWFSLLLQLLFLLLLIAGLTQPLWPWVTSDKNAVVIVIDSSASMRAKEGSSSRFEEAVAKARSFAGSLRSGQEVAVVLSGSVPKVLTGWTDSSRQLKEAFALAEPDTAAASPTAALELAKNLAASRSANVVFFTDGVWDGPVEDGSLEGIGVRLVGSESSNTGISRFSARRSPALPGEVVVFAEVRDSGTGIQGQISLSNNDRLVDAREVEIPPGQPWRKEWILQEPGAARLVVKFEGVTGDVLPFDDFFEIVVDPLKQIDAVLVSPPDPFLEAALAAVPALEVQRLWPPDTLKYGDDSKLWIFQGAIPPPDFQALGLVIVMPTESGFYGDLIGEMNEPWITEVDRNHEITRSVALDGVTVGRALEFQPAVGSGALVSSAGRPLIFGRWQDDPRWMVVAMDPSKSDLVMRAAFPILVSNLVQTLRGDSREFISSTSASPALTSLSQQLPADRVDQSLNSITSSILPFRPLWWWLLAVAILWLFVEWWTYHRRITE